MTITYGYGKNLYVNTTNRCTCACEFCIRTTGDGVGTASNLWLDREPTREEILADIQKQDLSRYDELVFCGYGEPTFRWDDIAWVCDQLRDAGPVPPIRMDTNGHGNVICGRDITPELKGRIDVVSISLNSVSYTHLNAGGSGRNHPGVSICICIWDHRWRSGTGPSSEFLIWIIPPLPRSRGPFWSRPRRRAL